MEYARRRVRTRQAGVLAGSLWLAAILLPGPALPAARIADWRLDVGVAEWQAGGDCQATQVVTSARAGLTWGRGWKLDAQLASQHARGRGGQLGLGEGLSGGLLLRYGPPAGRWLLQAGLSSPLASGRLALPERELIRRLAEPLLRFPDGDPLRGWRIHAGAVLGVPLRRGASLAAALGGEFTAAFEPLEGLRINPGDRLTARLVLQIGGTPLAAEGHASLVVEGPETAADVTIRDRRRVGTLGTGISLTAAGWQARLLAAYAGSNEVRYTDPELWGQLTDAGPGISARIVARVASQRVMARLRGDPIRTALCLDYERFMPHGLPIADGWSLCVGPEFSLVRAGGALALHLGWGTGQWRPFAPDEFRPREALRGWRVRLTYAGPVAAGVPAGSAPRGER